MSRPKANEPCPCESGKRYRQCCGKRWAQKKPTKPPEYLIVMRNVSRQPVEKDPRDNRLYQTYRTLLEKDPERFLDRLHKAEVEHKRALIVFKNQKRRAVHGHDGVIRGGKVAAPAAVVEEPPDLGEQKALELLEKLLRDKPWEKFRD